MSMSIELNAHQLVPFDLMTLPTRHDDGTITESVLDTSFLYDQDVIVNGYDNAHPEIKLAIDNLVAGNEWCGYKPKTIKFNQ